MSSPADASRQPLLRSLGTLVGAAGDRFMAGPLPKSPDQLDQELEAARRLGRWETEEDRRLVREHEARQVLARVRRGSAVSLVAVAWCVPLLWPLALVGSLRLFPRTTRRLLLSLLATGGLGLVTLVLLVAQVGRFAEPPSIPGGPALRQALPPALPSALPEALRP